ncbi:MAG: class I SAM-dependent methyltransferase [Bacteroidetes bacterium]|nr:MAG: class I SAM-dependent methyltransferase [Bacteroidota bacterium]MBL1145392.1 class I SAM-dependent methyltransferase [Bacteroidota bacterium]NOG58190.1 class I SAM-dependent methyltransferase [Bacteroidota bacterium]
MNCLFCNSTRINESYLPSTIYNNKKFDYLRCSNCSLIYLNPVPSDEDLIKMYPPSYQNGVDRSILNNPNQKLIGLRYSYAKHFDLLRSINFKGKMLDFGCGNAHFIINSNHHGFNCDGAEFNPRHVSVLNNEISESDFFSVDEFFQSELKYDLIRLSNVFEHFTNPINMLNQIKSKLKEGGYLLIEGPIETNFNFALVFRKIYFNLRKKLQPSWIVAHTPTHIIFTNHKNQLDVFNCLGLSTIHYELAEAEWPFPQSFSKAEGLISKLNVVIARTSMILKKLNKNWGNTFIYLGQN